MAKNLSEDAAPSAEKAGPAPGRFEPARILPPAFPCLRDFNSKDLARVADWLRKGRAENAFRQGADPTDQSLRAYHASMRKGGWKYRCLIVEDGPEPAGYLDLRWQGSSGEILGLFVEKSCRGRRLGSHALAVGVERLRAAGCSQVDVEIYAGNTPSQQAFSCAGFARHPRADRVEDGRRVECWRRQLPPLQRLQPANPRFQDLRGENIFEQHAAAASLLTRHLARMPGVGAVLGLGSLGRNFADHSSDIDLMVLGHGESLIRLPTGEHFVAGTSVDLFGVDLDSAPVAGWTVDRREALLESIVLHRAPGFRLDAIVKACRPAPAELASRVAGCLLRLGWIGFHPPAWDDKAVHGYFWAVESDIWRQRGDVDCAHQSVDHGLDLALQALYLINRTQVPDPKWRLFLATGVEWQPPRLKSRLAAIVRAGRDASTLDARIRQLRSLVGDLAAEAGRRRLLRGDIYQGWLKQTDDYSTTR